MKTLTIKGIEKIKMQWITKHHFIRDIDIFDNEYILTISEGSKGVPSNDKIIHIGRSLDENNTFAVMRENGSTIDLDTVYMKDMARFVGLLGLMHLHKQ